MRTDVQQYQRQNGSVTTVLVCGAASEKVAEVCRFLKAFAYETVVARSAERAIELAKLHRVQIALWVETGASARRELYIEAAKMLRAATPGTESILIAAHETAGYAEAAFRAGVYNCTGWPVDYANLARDLDFLATEAQRRRELWLWSGNNVEISFEGMTGGSKALQAICDQLTALARNNDPVLITGPVGSGKDLAACALHALMEKGRSASPYHPLMIYRCAGLSEARADELFVAGGILGPLNGADQAAATAPLPASMQSALELLGLKHPEVMLIDEISDLPPGAQQKLASWLLVNKAVRQSFPVRIVASSRCDLEALAERGKFHAGLLRLLKAQVIVVPSLTERLEDIPMLVDKFITQYAKEQSEPDESTHPALQLSRDAQRALLRHDWPGNVRELRNAIRRAAMLAKNSIIQAEDLGLSAPSHPPTRVEDWLSAEVHRRPVWLN